MRKESNKRSEIRKHGVDLSNYENTYTKVAQDMIVFNLYLMKKRYNYSEKELNDWIDWWLYGKVQKKISVGKKNYNVELAKDFVNFLLKH